MVSKLCTLQLLKNCPSHKLLIINSFARCLCTRAPQAIFIEKSMEIPVLVVAENDDVDIIGPPDSISNLRPIIRKQLLNESTLQQRLRQMQDATQQWNQTFWATHNAAYIRQRQLYIDTHQVAGEEFRQLTADEMSEFYKKFLDDNWEKHLKYNFEWYKKNFTLLVLAFRVNLEKNFAKLR